MTEQEREEVKVVTDIGAVMESLGANLVRMGTGGLFKLTPGQRRHLLRTLRRCDAGVVFLLDQSGQRDEPR